MKNSQNIEKVISEVGSIYENNCCIFSCNNSSAENKVLWQNPSRKKHRTYDNTSSSTVQLAESIRNTQWLMSFSESELSYGTNDLKKFKRIQHEYIEYGELKILSLKRYVSFSKSNIFSYYNNRLCILERTFRWSIVYDLYGYSESGHITIRKTIARMTPKFCNMKVREIIISYVEYSWICAKYKPSNYDSLEPL